MIKKASWRILILIILLSIVYWEHLIYGIRQAKGQLSITFNTLPVEEVLSNPSVTDSIKYKIQIVQEARLFSFDRLGLKQSENYTTFYDQKGEVSLWNLSACKPFAFEPKMWSFPVLGSFPYKGYFELEHAKKEMDELKKDGYDVRIRPVGGWSTLGWTSDPILSNMLDRSEGPLAELIIHELTHSTLFIKDNIEFNENLASFIGELGAIQYLNEKYGDKSAAYYDYIISEEDSRTFRNQMLLATNKLDSLYQIISDDPDSIKAHQKHLMIDEIMSSIDTLHFHDPRYYQIFNSSRPNNAYFMSYLRYYSSKDSLQDLLSSMYKDDLKLFIEGMKSFHDN
ncbi:aminopeptidase [Ekhidna sp.]|uniref:aminopeptidase n=1 Tax=Ekhidna sp. TaxID=2608089 RepID=UPI003B50D875